MSRTMTITMEITVDHLPLDEIDDLDQIARDCKSSPERAAVDLLDEAEDHDVAECIVQGVLDPGNFAGSGLFLKITDANIVGMKWHKPQPS